MTGTDPIIGWFPGHMAQSMRRLTADLRLIDAVVEVRDARLPAMSANPALRKLAAGKARIVVLAREDLADPHATPLWLEYFREAGEHALAVNGKKQGTLTRLSEHLAALTAGRKTARVMVVGIPNTGKSTIINGLLRRSAAPAQDRPGVTRAQQWFRLSATMELMDTPGILVPKIDTPEAQWMLALSGAIPRQRFDPENVVRLFLEWAGVHAAHLGVPDLKTYARSRGLIRHGGEIDGHNAGLAYLKDFNAGKFGRFTFERPPDGLAP